MKGFYFKTNSGNTYFYNDNNGSVIPVENMEDISAELKTLSTHRFNEKSDEIEIENFLQKDGYSQITLIVTEDCNLRCKYCAYSGNYENMRTHRNLYMTSEIARKAVEWYFKGFILVKEKNPYRLPVIGFYGGEPVLNFDLIHEIVDFAKSIYPGKIFFTITTNGTLLNSEIIDFFYEYDFSLSISLNGPKNEHDRLRVFPGGKGTFNIVWDNLQRIRKKYPEYYRKRCSILVDYDTGTDLTKLKNFFEIYEDELPPLINFFPIAPYFTHWYEQYSREQKEEFKRSLESIKEEYFEKLMKKENISVFLDSFLGLGYRMLLNRPQNISVRPSFLPYTGTCVPGHKIAVTPDGKFHCCEKINNRFPIGDVERGLDIKKVAKMIKNYREQIYPECNNCPIVRLCNICFAVVGGNGKFERNPSNICLIRRESIKKEFVELWSLFEQGVQESQILKTKTNFLLSEVRRG